MRRAPRRDENEADIVLMLGQIGASVQRLDATNAPDLLVGFRGRNFLIEIKDGTKVPSQRQLRPGQKRWHDRWHGQVAMCSSWSQVLDVVST